MFDDCRNGFRFHHDWGENMPFGRWMGHGFGMGGMGRGRFFERGILKYVILDLVKEQPRHGYDIIQELEKKFQGFYSPSPGSVYPTLQLLEDQGYVMGKEQSGKKVYTITEEGNKYIQEHDEEIKQIHSHLEHHFDQRHGAHLHELRDEIQQTAKIIFRNAASGSFEDPEKMKQIRLAFAHFRSELETIFSK